jgi:hypothetical protein
VCFDERIRDHLRDPANGKQATVTLVVCNERVELPMREELFTQVRYTGTMAVRGQFKSGYTEGLNGMDLEVRLFDFGYEITVDSATGQPTFPGVLQRPQAPFDPWTIEDGLCTFVQPNQEDTDYRKKLLELYALYWRTRQKQIATVSPCLPSPSMDYRETVDPGTGQIRYGHVSFFDAEIKVDDPEVRWKSTRDFFHCRQAWPIGSMIRPSAESFTECAMKDASRGARLAAINQEGLIPPNSNSEDINHRLNQALGFVVRAVGESEELRRYKGLLGGSLGGDATGKVAEKLRTDFKECDGGLWKKLVASKAFEGDDLSWGVVDEATFYNAPPVDALNKKKKVVEGGEMRELMYGGTVCANYERLGACFQFAVPAKVVFATKNLGDDDDGNAIEPGTLAYYLSPEIFGKIHINLRPKTADGRCRTGLEAPDVRYFFDKKWMRSKLEKSGDFNEGRQCPGSPLQ